MANSLAVSSGVSIHVPMWWWKTVRSPVSRLTARATRLAPSVNTFHCSSLMPISGVMRPALSVRIGSP